MYRISDIFHSRPFCRLSALARICIEYKTEIACDAYSFDNNYTAAAV